MREGCCQVDVRSVPSGPGLPGDLGGPQIHPGLEILGWPQPQLPARAPGTCRLARNPGKTQPANTNAFNNLTALYRRGQLCLTCPLKIVVILNPLQGRGPLQNPLEKACHLQNQEIQHSRTMSWFSAPLHMIDLISKRSGGHLPVNAKCLTTHVLLWPTRLES